MNIIGIDTGGTFTDFMGWDGRCWRRHKELSTPAAPEQAILRGLAALGLTGGAHRIVHGSTVATNALLEGKGARTVFVTNRGFGDLLAIGRQARAALYDLTPPVVAPPIAAELCLETGGRLAADGQVLEPLTADDLARLRRQVAELAPEAVAVCLLFSFLDDRAERAIEGALADSGAFVTRSSEVLPEFREYERGMATWLNAYVGPRMHGYLGALAAQVAPAEVTVMQSSGVTVAPDYAARHAVNLLLSGPAGGLLGARHVAGASGHRRLMTFDMGGTSTDVALIDGAITLTTEGRLGRYPVGVPMVDLHSIGAGGGSLARVDDGGLLQVGPESAGAHPGPACYGAGGTAATVTDAQVVLGRLPGHVRLGGRLALDVAAARAAVGRIARQLGGIELHAAARGIVDLANEHMAQALRVISVERGRDPRDYTLVSFGGAGGLHVCALAGALGMRQAMVPAHAGVLSALGLAVAPPGRQYSRTVRRRFAELDDATTAAALAALSAPGVAELSAAGHPRAAIVTRASVDVCYAGQSSTINLAWEGVSEVSARFHREHLQRYGHQLDLPLELVNLRAAVTVELPAPPVDRTVPADGVPDTIAALPAPAPGTVPCHELATLEPGALIVGPAVVVDAVATAYVDTGWRALVDPTGNLLLAID